ncbi:MAG: hypothetical protein ACW99F_00515 [Candidatus Hodarchaeales archaeon]
MPTQNELSDKNNRISWTNDKINDLRIDDIYNQIPENFEAIILSGVPEQSNDWQGTTTASEATIAQKNNSRYYFVRVRPLGIQDLIIPDPFSAADLSTAKRLINSHPMAYIEVHKTVHPPTHGDVFLCRYTTKDKRGISLIKKLRRSDNKIGSLSNQALHTAFNPDKNPGLVKNYGASIGAGGAPPAPLGGNPGQMFGGEHIIEKLEAGVSPSAQPVIGIGSPQAAKQAQEEVAWWSPDKGETDLGKIGNNDKNHPVYRRIQLFKYYVALRKKPEITFDQYFPNYETDENVKKQHIGGSAEKGTGDSKTGIMHWSATSISWVMRGTGFPRSSGHSRYSQKIRNLKGSTGWEIHSLVRERVKIQPGDVLVKPGKHGRGKTRLTASHGDVVYKVQGNMAYLAGGNIGRKRGTFADTKKGIPLDANGYPTATGRYLIILKKMR